jgi:hypothetical protein
MKGAQFAHIHITLLPIIHIGYRLEREFSRDAGAYEQR